MPISVISEADFRPRSFKEAARAFGRRVPVTEDEFKRLTAKHQSQAFKIASVNNARLIQQARDVFKRAIDQGKTFQQIRAELQALFDAKGLPRPALSRLRFSFEEGVRRAYGEARDEMLADPEIVEAFPFNMYLTVGNGQAGFRNVRPEHAALHRKVLRWDDPGWIVFRPPWDYGCRCSRIALTAGQVRRGRMTVWTYKGGRLVPVAGPAAKRKGKRKPKSIRLDRPSSYRRSSETFDLSGLDADLREALAKRLKGKG